MSPDNSGSTPRAHVACNTCRVKKRKCPGEEPICSVCRRLGQTCGYGPSTTAPHSGITKARNEKSQHDSPSASRVQRLESRVEEIFSALSALTDRVSDERPVSTSPIPRPAGASYGSLAQHHARGDDSDTDTSARFDARLRSEPPKAVFKSLVEIYENKIHGQPLPLFDPTKLLRSMSRWPSVLRWSFFSLVVTFSKHSFFDAKQYAAVTFYTKSARREVMALIAENDISLDLIQAICLLSLRQIASAQSNAALIDIGIGIRLALTTKIMSKRRYPDIPANSEDRSRCCWSLFILDRMYGTSLLMPSALAIDDIMPSCPTSASTPTRRSTGQIEEQADLSSQLSRVEDLGVNVYCMQLLAVWGDVISYLRIAKDNPSDEPWATDSMYNRVLAKIFTFETKMSQAHRFQKARFHEHALEELEEQRAYWGPWLLMQCLFHTIQALINHPFLHIAGRPKDMFPPPSFLQTAVDQTKLHVAWVIKLIDACAERDFMVNDPFVSHLVSITATIYLFFLNSKDTELAAHADAGVRRCYDFIIQASAQWPNLIHTIEKLDTLHKAANTTNTDPAVTSRSGSRAQKSLLWELFDYSVSTRPSTSPDASSSEVVDMNVNTHFLSPVNPLSTASTPVAAHQTPNPYAQAQNTVQQGNSDMLWGPATAETNDMNIFDIEQMADLTNFTLPRDLWGFGQL